MNKKQVQQRVLKDGKPLALKEFTWDERTNTFSSYLDGLVIDFSDVTMASIKCAWDCTIKCGSYCTIACGSYCIVTCDWRCTIACRSNCTIACSNDCTTTCGNDCIVTCCGYCTITCAWNCIITCDNDCTITCDWGCTITCGNDCTIVRHYPFEVIQHEGTIQTCPYGIYGYLVEKDGDFYNEAGEECIIADGILSKIISKKGNVYKVVNHKESEPSYLVKSDDMWAHGQTIEEARDSLRYKISIRDTSTYDGLGLESELPLDECIKMYRVVTGACEAGVRDFVESRELKDKYTIRELLELTKGHFGNEVLRRFVADGHSNYESVV